MTTQARILMCAPEHYTVNYVINPWMEGNIHKSAQVRAQEQWARLHQTLQAHTRVELVEPRKEVPDMVFTANAGLVYGSTVIVSRFFHVERQREEPYFKAWFESKGFQVRELPRDLPFEGAGDALFDRLEARLWAGYGFRSELESHAYISEWLDVEVLSLRLIDERFYHLDTCFCPLRDGYLLYYPPAFDSYSNQLIERRVPKEKRIVVNERDALNFACNAVNVDSIVVLNQASTDLRTALETKGFAVVETPLTEFLKAGGAAKCLTLRLDEGVYAQTNTPPATVTRTVQFEGHLLDSGIINSALDTIVDAGGSFQILSFNLGEQRQSASVAEVKVVAPSAEILDTIMSQLIGIGAKSEQVRNARTETVTIDGTAPDDFYVTTIYPTEVLVDQQWVKVQQQRMDGAIVVSRTGTEIQARCCLLRDLRKKEDVVVGVDGIRTVHKSASRENRPQQEFVFMGSGVSSERRVELVVEQIAWELRQIRDRGGKVVVTAGPVVIHTGGAAHLSTLIRNGYVQALLGGNAIAVHDIEQAILGTSLGVDLTRGVPVKGGHRHHLKVINAIRRAGSIANAVESGMLSSGVFYECVQHNVPFSLAGSIRDDGPLPETQMDLIKAQTEYSTLLEGADLILLLSSMLHAIGVGNMTPWGPKLVCVDINPAVVTKLTDRGSTHSVGVVTDVGLFLSLLVQQLEKLTLPYAQ